MTSRIPSNAASCVAKCRSISASDGGMGGAAHPDASSTASHTITDMYFLLSLSICIQNYENTTFTATTVATIVAQ